MVNINGFLDRCLEGQQEMVNNNNKTNANLNTLIVS